MIGTYGSLGNVRPSGEEWASLHLALRGLLCDMPCPIRCEWKQRSVAFRNITHFGSPSGNGQPLSREEYVSAMAIIA